MLLTPNYHISTFYVLYVTHSVSVVEVNGLPRSPVRNSESDRHLYDVSPSFSTPSKRCIATPALERWSESVSQLHTTLMQLTLQLQELLAIPTGESRDKRLAVLMDLWQSLRIGSPSLSEYPAKEVADGVANALSPGNVRTVYELFGSISWVTWRRRSPRTWPQAGFTPSSCEWPISVPAASPTRRRPRGSSKWHTG